VVDAEHPGTARHRSAVEPDGPEEVDDGPPILAERLAGAAPGLALADAGVEPAVVGGDPAAAFAS
jgi:hypothetical protein